MKTSARNENVKNGLKCVLMLWAACAFPVRLNDVYSLMKGVGILYNWDNKHRWLFSKFVMSMDAYIHQMLILVGCFNMHDK